MLFRIKEARELVQLSQKELAQKLNISPATLNGYESGKHDPRSDTLCEIADICGVSVDFLLGRETKKAPSITDEAETIARKYNSMNAVAQGAVNAVVEYFDQMVMEEFAAPRTKVIPLIGNSFAAGKGEPDFGNAWENYEVSASNPADFAIRINGNSMEPYLPDGSIAFGVRRNAEDGDVAAFLLDGEFYCKQVCQDAFGNMYCFSLNRDRADADFMIRREDDRKLLGYGTIIMSKRVPLPER